MKFSTKVCLIVLAAYAAAILAQAAETVDPRVRTYVDPVRVVWKTEGAAGYVGRCKVSNEAALLAPKFGQVRERDACQLESAGNAAAIVLDFGRELHGGLQIEVNRGTRCSKVRVRFGESVAETFSDALSGERGAGNDHAMRDFEIMLPVYGSLEVGNTGFRFVRLDLLTSGSLDLGAVRAVSLMRPMKRLGSFRCSDERLNRVFETAVRTVHLCCQDYLWDGIKRDRLVWMGDMHPETCVILDVFGGADVLRDSLDHVIATTPPKTKWMNGMVAYTLWWFRNMAAWYRHTGDLDYIRRHHAYLADTADHALSCITPENRFLSTDRLFLDWPSEHNRPAIEAGIQGLAVSALGDAAYLADALGDADLASRCRDGVKRLLSQTPPDPNGSKQAAALLALAGLRDRREMFDGVIGRDGHKGVSTFYGYYMLVAMSAAGENQRALDTVRDYWGAMLDVGATSFWENFDLSWTNNCFRIDELPVAGKKDVHGDYGEFCYPGFRHSLCHGWSAGPAAWLIDHVLGVRPTSAGFKTYEVKPFLGDLEWAEGSIALPGGRSVFVRVQRGADGQPVVQTNEIRGSAPER